MKRTLMLCLALLAGGAISAKAQTRVNVAFGLGTPGFAGFVTVGQPWYWYGGQRVFYVRRYYSGRPMYFYNPRFVPEDWRAHDRVFFERQRDWDHGRVFADRDRGHDRRDVERDRGHDRGRHKGQDRDH
jgi:hypothetical protein